MKVLLSVVIAIVVIIATAVNLAPVKAHSCYKDGYADGRDYPFSPYRFFQCGDVYSRGFIAGCLSGGTPKYACISAEASYPHPRSPKELAEIR